MSPGCIEDGWMRTCLYIFGGVMMFQYDTKGVILSVVTREVYGRNAGSFLSVRSWSRMRGSDRRVSRKQLARHAGPTRERPVSRGS